MSKKLIFKYTRPNTDISWYLDMNMNNMPTDIKNKINTAKASGDITSSTISNIDTLQVTSELVFKDESSCENFLSNSSDSYATSRDTYNANNNITQKIEII